MRNYHDQTIVMPVFSQINPPDLGLGTWSRRATWPEQETIRCCVEFFAGSRPELDG